MASTKLPDNWVERENWLRQKERPPLPRQMEALNPDTHDRTVQQAMKQSDNRLSDLSAPAELTTSPELLQAIDAFLYGTGVVKVKHVELNEVRNPKYYQVFPDGTEALDILRNVLTPEEFRGYLKGNILKYRLRAGKKRDTLQDIEKALHYDYILKEEME